MTIPRRRSRSAALEDLASRLADGEYDGEIPPGAKLVISTPGPVPYTGDRWYVAGHDAWRMQSTRDKPVLVSRIINGAWDLRRIARMKQDHP